MSNYKLSFDCKFFCDEETFYFRKGIWNTIDGMIPFTNIQHKEEFCNFLKSVKDENETEQNKCITRMSDNDKNLVYDLLENNFIIDDEHESLELCRVLTGQNFNLKNRNVKFQFITDLNYVTKLLNDYKEIYNFEFTAIPEEIKNELKDPNYFSRIDSVSYEKKREYIKSKISEDSPILFLTQNLNLHLIRNLNKILENTPIFIGFIDGPFMIFLSIIPKQTACWECFEQRMLSFVKDNYFYHRFNCIDNEAKSSRIYNLHFTTLLHMGLQEVFAWNLLKMSKFMGRCMFTYLPTMEIHFENINRISSCKTCGYMAEISNSENNANLGRLIDEYLKETGNKNAI